MAREQRYDVDYFPHQCTHGRKMHIIETKYGNDGYAVWFKLLEQLGKANFHFIDISDEMNFMFLTSIFKVEEERLKCILNDLAKLGAIEKSLYEDHQILYSEKFVNSVEDAYKKRKSNILLPEQILRKLNIKKNQSATETHQSDAENLQSATETPSKQVNREEVIPKEKKRKEKERKEERNAGEKTPSPSLAYDLLKLEKESEMESFEMQNKKLVKKWKDLVDNFNDTVDIELSKGKIDWESEQLLPRLRKWTRSWINNQEKSYENVPADNSYESGKQKRF